MTTDDDDTTIPVFHADISPLPTVPFDQPSVRLYASAPATYSLQIFARRRVNRGSHGAPLVATAALDLEQLRVVRAAADVAIAKLERASRPIGSCSPLELANPASDRKLAIDVARRALHAVRNPNHDGSAGGPLDHPWAYFAEETRSWWGITSGAMIELADMLEAARSPANTVGLNAADCRQLDRETIDAWAEADATAIELDRALSRRLSREHGR